MKLDVSLVKGTFKVADVFCLINFEWYSQNEVDNIEILVTWRDCKKTLLSTLYLYQHKKKLRISSMKHQNSYLNL